MRQEWRATGSDLHGTRANAVSRRCAEVQAQRISPVKASSRLPTQSPPTTHSLRDAAAGQHHWIHHAAVALRQPQLALGAAVERGANRLLAWRALLKDGGFQLSHSPGWRASAGAVGAASLPAHERHEEGRQRAGANNVGIGRDSGPRGGGCCHAGHGPRCWLRAAACSAVGWLPGRVSLSVWAQRVLPVLDCRYWRAKSGAECTCSATHLWSWGLP